MYFSHILSNKICVFLYTAELEAYGSMISVLRAQGPLTDDKQKLLQQLAKLLHISDERHRCEIRRVANDQNLAAIAEQYVFCMIKKLITY